MNKQGGPGSAQRAQRFEHNARDDWAREWLAGENSGGRGEEGHSRVTNTQKLMKEKNVLRPTQEI